MNDRERPWATMAVPWVAMSCYGLPWVAMGCHELPWVAMVDLGSTMGVHRVKWAIMVVAWQSHG